MDAGQTTSTAVEALPLGPLRDALSGAGAHVVGGWVRELVAGRDPGGDVDVAVEGELEAILDELDPALPIEVHERHRRFGAARVEVGGLRVDLTRTRRESYAHPGALPRVEPAPIGVDLRRRDFSVNALAVPLDPPHELLDPCGGVADLRSGTLRVLHERSFVDDPTRAIRAARYAARLGLEPDPETLGLLRACDLGLVSADRRRAELARLAAEQEAPEALRLLARWSLLHPGEEALALIEAVDGLSSEPPWSADPALRSRAILIVACEEDRARAALALAGAAPERPSAAVRLASGHQPAELLVAAAAGARWVRDYVERWQGTSLEIGGEDLISAGIAEGPAVGAGLRGALERKLDGGLSGGREAELAVALELARRAI